MTRQVAWGIVAALFIASAATAKETLVANVAEFDAAVKAAQVDDQIVLKNGEWHDVDLVFKGSVKMVPHSGLPNSGVLVLEGAIVLRAETPGKVILTGRSHLRIGGRGLFVQDLLWKDAAAEECVISFRIDSKTFAEHSFVHGCAIMSDTPDSERKWVSLYGTQNQVTSCRFEGKQSPGTLLVVWLGDGPSEHQIDHNFFGPRVRLGKNGGEIIRVGDSKTSLQEAKTTVLGNYFYRCDGEAEIISNKSCGNYYLTNTFVGCGGALTLRHGHRCILWHNRFFGDGRKGTGGVRVIGEDHRIINNTFDGLTGDDGRAALSLMNGIADTPLNGYSQVKRPQVIGNLFLNCKQSIVVGTSDKDQKKQTEPPLEGLFKENVVVSNDEPVFTVRTAGEGFKHEQNVFSGSQLGLPAISGWEATTIATHRDDNGKLIVDTMPQAGAQKIVPLSEVGPKWLPPGDEFLPDVWKGK